MPKKKRPYIAFELDGIEDAEQAARLAGVNPDVIVAGLPRLWRDCWRRKSDRVRPEELGAFFTGGADEKLRRALATKRFIEIDGDPAGDRVKGASRLLRISDSKRAGGHAAKGNLKRGKQHAKANRPEETAESTLAPRHMPEESADSPGIPPAGPRLLQPAASSHDPLLPPLPPSARGAESKSCTCKRHPCRHQAKPDAGAGRVLELGQCAACGAGASAGFGGVKLCYGGCLTAGEAWAREHNPEKPWEADVVGWAMAQRAMGAAEVAQ